MIVYIARTHPRHQATQTHGRHPGPRHPADITGPSTPADQIVLKEACPIFDFPQVTAHRKVIEVAEAVIEARPVLPARCDRSLSEAERPT
jgi:hypothetical protein